MDEEEYLGHYYITSGPNMRGAIIGLQREFNMDYATAEKRVIKWLYNFDKKPIKGDNHD